jgi:hypothetical protein
MVAMAVNCLSQLLPTVKDVTMSDFGRRKRVFFCILQETCASWPCCCFLFGPAEQHFARSSETVDELPSVTVWDLPWSSMAFDGVERDLEGVQRVYMCSCEFERQQPQPCKLTIAPAYDATS